MESKPLDSRKSVIIFSRALSSGGAEKQSILLAKALNDKYNVVLIFFVDEMKLERNIKFLNNEKIIYYQLTGNVIKKIRDFCKLIGKIRPYSIINFLPGNNFLGGALGRLFGIKCIIGSIRTTKINTNLKFIQLLISHVFFNHSTVFNSKAGFKHNYNRGFRGKKSSVIQNCLYPMPERTKRANTEIVILIVSRFEECKDYPTALEAFKLIKELYPEKNIKLEIVGQGAYKQMVIDWVRDNNLQSHITITVNPENVNEHYIKSTIFLQTSLTEGFSNSIMEAMVHSLPIIATDVGDNSQMVIDGVNGYIVPVKRPDIIVNRLCLLIESDKRRQDMGSKSYDIIKDDFSIEKFSSAFSKIIEK